jgi:hypothetical protein
MNPQLKKIVGKATDWHAEKTLRPATDIEFIEASLFGGLVILTCHSADGRKKEITIDHSFLIRLLSHED